MLHHIRKTALRYCCLTAPAALALGIAGQAFAQKVPPPPAPPPPAKTTPVQQQRPNVLVWLLDDVGFAQFGSFGGLIATPNIDRVANMGLRYTNYHTAPVCSAARASLLTGRMPHSVNIGGHAAVARPIPGYTARIPDSAGTVADNLHAAGYATYALGKWDHLLAEESTPAGPFRQWPTGQGFERFYGFLSADTDNWHPTLVRDQSPVPTPKEPGYHLNRDLADEAIDLIDTQHIANPARPFFMYWATGTAHAPHHAPADWIARYKGKFDMGWDALREQILERQKAGGLIPQGARLAPRPEGMPAWDSLNPEQKKLYTRQMEVFAASLSYADAQFGRILDKLEKSGDLDNTIVVVTSDNGASAEGAQNGMFTEALLATGKPASLEENLPFYEAWGGPQTYPHYSFGWAVAGNTPFRYFKHATHEGGTHVPFVIAWPKGITARGEIRSQFTHVADIAPTILDAANVPLADRVNNVQQSPMEGISFAYTFDDATAQPRKDAQYFEMFGNKGLWSQGWSIVTSHRLEPWDMATTRPIDEPWELYNLQVDPGQIDDLSGQHPERVAEMNRLFEEQAVRYHVNPIGNISEGMMETARKAREDFARRGGVWRYGGPVSNIQQTVGPPLSALGFTMSAKMDLQNPAVTAPIFAGGGRLGGMALYLRQGRPVFVVNTMQGETTEIAARSAVPAGTSDIRLEFRRATGSGPAPVVISVNDKVVAQGQISADTLEDYRIFELIAVGIDGGTAVLPGAQPDTPFPGSLSDIVFDFRVPNTAPAAASTGE
ncbi:MAG: arylsulfatase [Novosphingobium sp.]|nr:arylsulfatase [Novosphingobium sp.]